jgi:hypothetical protein
MPAIQQTGSLGYDGESEAQSVVSSLTSGFRPLASVASPLPNILCLPYQPLDGLAASLSAADLHVVVMGNEFVGIVHPCKIYNVLTVGAPVLYIGPQPSHVTDILESMGDSPHCAGVAHGDVEGTVRHIRRVAELGTRGELELFRRTADQFSIRNLLPKQIGLLDGAAVGEFGQRPTTECTEHTEGRRTERGTMGNGLYNRETREIRE